MGCCSRPSPRIMPSPPIVDRLAIGQMQALDAQLAQQRIEHTLILKEDDKGERGDNGGDKERNDTEKAIPERAGCAKSAGTGPSCSTAAAGCGVTTVTTSVKTISWRLMGSLKIDGRGRARDATAVRGSQGKGIPDHGQSRNMISKTRKRKTGRTSP